MSEGLASLSRELRNEFDQRQGQLRTLLTKTRLELQQEREERQRTTQKNSLHRQAERQQLSNDVQGLIKFYQKERQNLQGNLQQDHNSQVRQLNEWARDREKQFEAWAETVRYTRKIRRGR